MLKSLFLLGCYTDFSSCNLIKSICWRWCTNITILKSILRKSGRNQVRWMRLTILHPEMCVSMVSFIAGYEKSCFRFGVRTDNSHLCGFVNEIYNQLSCSLSFYLNWYGEFIINYYDFLLGLYVYATFVQYNNAREGIKTCM